MTEASTIPSVKDILQVDLDYISDNLADEFGQMAGSNLLITGGAGFLGYYLVQSVLHWNRLGKGDPISVTVYDNYSRGLPEWLSQLDQDPANRLRLVKHDLTDPLPSDIDDFDYIIHGACIASPTFYRQHPIETMDANTNGLRHLLDYCVVQKERGKPVRGFLFYSTSEIYGDPVPEMIPTPEDYRGNVSCTGPRACYDESKRFGETLCVNFQQVHDLPITIARPFNNYGPGLKITDRRVIPDFANDVLNGRDIVMFSDGSPTRTFCYTADAVVGYYKVLIRGRPGEAYNIGVETPEISIAELADKIIATAQELFGYQGKLVRQQSDDADYLVDNPNRRCPNIAKARRDLDFSPGILVDEGIRRSLIWYHHNRQGEDL